MQNKILLVEDKSTAKNYIYNKLEQLDCDVLAKANNCDDAVKLAKDLKPNLILLDINLNGEKDIIETASEILSFLDVPVVYVTAQSDEKTIKRLMKVEPNAFIIKPFDERILRSAIDIAVYRHQVKKELLETKEILRTTIESIDDILISFDCKGYIKYMHSSHENNKVLLNTKKPEQKHYSNVFPDSLVKMLDVCFDNLFKTKIVQEFEVEIKKQNKNKWYHAKASLRKDIYNKAIGITLIISDISKNKDTEKKIILENEKIKEAQKIVGLGICEIDHVTNKLTHNNIFFELLDIDDYQNIMSLDDNKILDVIHPDDKTRYLEYHKEILANKNEEFSIYFRIIDRSKNIRHIYSRGKTRYDSNKNTDVFLITMQDVLWNDQSQKHDKDKFIKQKSAEIKQQFFSGVSHQLRTPLTEIIGMIGLLSKTDLTNKQQKYLSTLRNSSETLINMISDISDISKIEADKLQLYPGSYNIRQNVERIIGTLQRFTDDNKIDLHYCIDDKIPENIFVDGKRVNQIIFNLLLNGIKYTKEGYVGLNIKIDRREGFDNNIYAEVKDTGVGIRKEDQTFLFKALHNSYYKSGSVGKGFGLYICKNLVNLLEGDIGVNSEPGKGSTFWFTFKYKECTDKDSWSDQFITKEDIPGNLNMSVLLVEDNEENQKVLSMMLESIGCEVKIASDGKQAIELYHETIVNAFGIFEKVSYDIIIMDMYMPVMDGIAATKELHKIYDELPPIIGLSASVLDNYTEESYNDIGFTDYLVKPVRIEILAEKLFYWKNKIKKEYEKPGLIPDDFFISNIENHPIINKNTINNIIKHGVSDEVNIKSLLNSFIEDMDEYYYQSLDAFKKNDQSLVKQIIVAVKGLSATIGASQVHEVTKRMEYHVEMNNFEQVKTLFPLMSDKYMEFKEHVESKYL